MLKGEKKCRLIGSRTNSCASAARLEVQVETFPFPPDLIVPDVNFWVRYLART